MNSDVANKRHCIRALQQRKAVAIVETPLINEEQAHVFVTHTNEPNKMQFKNCDLNISGIKISIIG